MKSILAQLGQFLILTLLLVSPMFFFPPPLPAQSSIPSPQITPLTIPETHQPLAPNRQSKFALLLAQEPQPEVLGTHASQETTEEQNKTEKSLPQTKGTYTIALLGDSMIDVMQPELPQLASALKKYYPQAQFKLLNYGVGASNLEYALTRLSQNYTYLGRDFSALLSQNPDIIVIESFAYNHGENSQSGLDKQWLTLAGIIDTIKKNNQAKIVLAATIGPDENSLCDGIDGINLPPDQKKEKAQAIRNYLQNIINFASSQGYPLADAYHPSLDSRGNGQALYINAGDHLHPSGPGGELFAQKIAEAIYNNNLL